MPTAPPADTPWTGASALFSPDHPTAPGESTGLLYSQQDNSHPAGEYDWWMRNTNFNNRIYPFGSTLPFASLPGNGQGATFQFQFVGNVVAQAILHAVSKEEKGDLLLAPRLTMYNNQRAYMMTVEQQSYISDIDVSGDQYDPVISAIMTGIVLDVKPTVSHDRRYVTLTMQPATADQLDFDRQFITGPEVNLPIDLPIIRLRSIRSTVTIPDGGSILLSGLMTDVKFSSSSGVPFLADLPIIGRLFGSDLKQREKINLIVLVSTNLILFDEEEGKL